MNLLLICASWCLVRVSLVECDPIFALIGDQVEFPPFKERDLKGCRLMHRREDGSDHLVAEWDGLWTPGPEYRDRMTPNGTVIFNSANPNDEGLYDLNCSTGTDFYYVHVFLLTASTVTEGDSVHFECYAKTAGEVGLFTVERDGKLVFRLDYRSGIQTQGAGFEDRVSIPTGWETTGDLTVTLNRVTPGDEGVYVFYVQYEDKSGLKEKLRADRLTVNPRVPDPTPSSPPTSCPAEQNVEWPWIIATVVLAVVLVLVVLAVGVGIFWYHKHHRPRRPEDSPESPDEGILSNLELMEGPSWVDADAYGG